MAWQGRRLCHPGPRRGADLVGFRLLHQRRRSAVVRDRASAGRAGISRALRRELLIGAGPGEWRAAWLEDGLAAELYVERELTRPVGSIRLGRIVRLVGALDAALVDIGEERPG